MPAPSHPTWCQKKHKVCKLSPDSAFWVRVYKEIWTYNWTIDELALLGRTASLFLD